MRKSYVLPLILALLLLIVAGTHFVKLGKPNPYAPIPAPVHPKITILSPEDNMLHAANALTISFNVSINFEKGWSYISYVTYKASWQQDTITVYEWRTNDSANTTDDPQLLSEFSYKLNLTGIPEGKQNVTISAGGQGGYDDEDWGQFLFSDAYNFTSVSFTVDNISILSPQNKTYDTSDVPLLFRVDESFAQISYSLDGQDKVIISGNATLTDVPNGEHTVAVYAMDAAGNTGMSETVFFSVEVPFPTVPVAAASVAAVAVVGVGLLVYFKKRTR